MGTSIVGWMLEALFDFAPQVGAMKMATAKRTRSFVIGASLLFGPFVVLGVLLLASRK
jgi:hypothetical protein